MSRILDSSTPIVVQGLTGRAGAAYTGACRRAGANVVAGVVPGRGGDQLDGIPIFDTVYEARSATGCTLSCIFVPGAHALDAVGEAADAGVSVVICCSRRVPLVDATHMVAIAAKSRIRLIGPSAPGIIVPGEAAIGALPPEAFMPGHVGIASRSTSLTRAVAYMLTSAGIGQSASIGVGADPIVGTTLVDAMRMLQEDERTETIVAVGGPSGLHESLLPQVIREEITKPVVALMPYLGMHPKHLDGYAETLLHNEPSPEKTVRELAEAGVRVVTAPEEVPKVLSKGFPQT